MKSRLCLTFALLCSMQAAASAVAQIASDGNRSIGPAYTPDPSLVARPEVPNGTVIEFKMDSIGSSYFPGQSQVAGAFSRRVWVYVPKQYVKGEKAPFMVSQDAIYRPWLINFLDNAIHDKKLPIMVIIFADNGGNNNGIGVAHVQGTERNLEYDTVSARYGLWVQGELLPRVEAETRSQIPNQAVRLTSDPEGRGAIGCSSGAGACQGSCRLNYVMIPPIDEAAALAA
jgi:iron(III)-enterobactin esterase